MDILTGLGILGESISRNQSYRDIEHIREETRKANELAQKKNALLKEQNELLKALANEKGIDLESIKQEQRERDHEAFTKALEERQRKKAAELGISVEEYKARKSVERSEDNSGCTTIILVVLGILGIIGFFV